MAIKNLKKSLLNKITPTLVFFSFNFLRFQLKKSIFSTDDIILPITRNWCYKLAYLLKSQKINYRNYKKTTTYRLFGKRKRHNFIQILVIGVK
jgi:hypothetical protein